jgi:hypothetical protein
MACLCIHPSRASPARLAALRALSTAQLLGKRYAKPLGVCGCSLLESSETFVLKLLRSRVKVVKLESWILKGLETGGSKKVFKKRKLSLA